MVGVPHIKPTSSRPNKCCSGKMKITGPYSTGLRVFSYTSILLLGLQASNISIPPSPLINIFFYFWIFLKLPGDILAYLISRNLPLNIAIIIGALSPFLAAFCWAILGYWIHRLIKKRKRTEQGVPGYDPQAVAMHTPSHAAHLSSTARGSSPEP